MLSLTKRVDASASKTCTPPPCRLRDAHVSVPAGVAAVHGRNGSLLGTERQPWFALGQRSGCLLLGPSCANRNWNAAWSPHTNPRASCSFMPPSASAIATELEVP